MDNDVVYRQVAFSVLIYVFREVIAKASAERTIFGGGEVGGGRVQATIPYHGVD